METNRFYLITFVILLALSVWILNPFILPAIGGIIVGYVFYPVYKRMNKHIKRKWLSSIILTLLIILIFTIPLIMLGSLLVNDTYSNYILLKQRIGNGLSLEVDCTAGFFCHVEKSINDFISSPQVSYYINDGLSRASAFVLEKSSNFVSAIPKKVVDFLIFVIMLFYTFKDGEFFTKKLELMPLKISHRKKLITNIEDMIFSTIYGQILIALIQGAIATVAYYLAGINSPILWGFITFIFAMIPGIGPVIIWLPASLFIMIDGLSMHSNFEFLQGLGLLIFGAVIILLLDNVLKPKIIGDRVKIHPLLIMFGMFGGLMLFGLVGLFLGPLIIGLFVTFFDLYREDWGAVQ